MKLSYSTPRTMYTVTSAARISSGSFDSELRNDAAVPWKSACRLAGIFIPFCSLVIFSIASPSDACGARLKLTVIEGNCPWCVIDSGSVAVSKCENALSGIALLGTELVAPAEFAPNAVVPAVSTRAGGASVPADGVYIVVAGQRIRARRR